MPGRDRKASTIEEHTDLSALAPDEARDVLASALEPDPKSGVLRLSGEVSMILRPSAIVNIQRQLEQTIGGSAKGIMYLAGERSSAGGLNPMEPAVSTPGRSLPLAAARRIFDTAGLIGWGRLQIATFDPERDHFVLSVTNSPLATAYGPSKKPVCHFLAGWIAGLGRLLLQKDLLCEEIACAAQGRGRCEFELRPMPS